MPPIPLEGVSMPVSAAAQEGNRGGSMSLGMLIDLIVQRTYHELTVLAELLPRKTDMERKIEIYNYSARTRQLFVRLLALVKWANSASKVDKSSQIMAFLDKQSLLFVDTADLLARMARDTLVHARLPNFHIPAAVEVLTTGTYSRLPACIRDRIVPPDPITFSERRTTLDRLNRVIQHRLVTGQLLPQMRSLKIDAGRVTFTVDHEFQVSLTVMGDGPNIPWRLLDIDILVDEKETGEGKALVHPLQVQYVHQVVQTRLVDNPAPLSEVYYTLHFFCQCLQLEVLYSQTLRLIRDRLDDLIQVDDYTPGKCLTVSYWKELASKDPKSELGFRLTVQVDQVDPARPLAVVHVPSLPGKESDVADRAIRSDQLSMERLLVHTIYLRTKKRLAELKQELEVILEDVECVLQGSPVILSVPVLVPCLRAEHLLITVDTHSGMLQCHVPQYDPPLLPELQNALNSDRTKVAGFLTELRFWMTMRRCEKTLQHLPATAHERLPLLHLPDHPMTRIGRHRVYVRLHRHPNTILIVELKERPPHDVDTQFYMAVVKQSSIEDDPEDDSIETEIPKMYLKVMTLVELDSFVLLHGPFTPIEEDQGRTGTKRKGGPSRCDQPSRRARQPAYFLADLAHVVALCDERIPFVTLAQELTRRDIAHQGLQVEANATALVLRILQLPSPSSKVTSASWKALLKRLLSVSIRSHGKGTGRCWFTELVFHGSPLQSQAPREAGPRRPVYCQYEMGLSDQPGKTVDTLLADWAQIVHLHDLANQLAEHISQNKQNIAQLVVVKSYTYNKMVIGYGPEKGATVTIHWCEEKKAFTMLFGASGQSKNAHGLLREQLEAHLNRHRDLPTMLHLLNETYMPLLSISKLPTTPQLGVHNNRAQVPVQTFTLIPQSHRLIRLVYQGMYCLELRLKGNGVVTIRDGAYSRFDRSNVVDELTPTQGLKGFLGKYVEETAALRRRSQCEDDDPPSPIAMDSDSIGGSSSGSFLNPRGPHSPAGLKFHAPVTPPSGSNPHTPSSPHTGLSQSHSQTYGSPATSFNLASPPSLPPTINPSPSMLPHASPGGLLASSPSNPMHVPSPAGLLPIASPGPIPPGHSPGYLQGHLDGSPFPASQSPAVSNWPGSPSLPRPSPARPGQSPSATHPSRVLPQRSWAGAVPTQLTNEALDSLCSPSPHPQGLPGPEMSPLERFLGCVYMRRALQRFIQAEDCLTGIPNTEPLVVLFKVETLQYRVGLNSTHLQSLHLKITPLPEHKDQWSAEDLQIIERFFDSRAAAPPYRPNSLCGFGRMLNVPINILKDIVQVLKLELVPGLIQQQGFKWSIQWCLRVPPSATPLVPVGQPGVITCRNKILFYLNLTRVGIPFLPGMEPPSLVLPLVYDITSNLTQSAEKRDVSPASAVGAATMQLKRFAEFGQHTGECSLFPAVRDLLANFTLPSEPPQMMSSPAHTGSVTPTMQPSPAMMHSPMSVPNMNNQQVPISQQTGMPQQGPGSYPGMGMGQHMMGPN